MDSYFGCLKWVSKSVQVLLNGAEAAIVPAFIALKERTCFWRCAWTHAAIPLRICYWLMVLVFGTQPKDARHWRIHAGFWECRPHQDAGIQLSGTHRVHLGCLYGIRSQSNIPHTVSKP